MAILSAQQVYALAVGAGLDGADAITATAVAGPGAESGWNTDAFNGSDPHGGSIGLWQINGVHWDRYGGKEALRDPRTNAKAMADISAKGKDWSPWGGYTSGNYKANLPAATEAAKAVGDGGGGGGGILGSIDDAVTGIMKAPADLLGQGASAIGGQVQDAIIGAVKALFGTAIVRRILYVLGGIILAGVGAVFLGKDAFVPTGGVTTIVKKVAKGGR